MGSTSTNHGNGHIGINSVKDELMGQLAIISIMREIVFDEETVY
jgi:hypothetical protein